MEQCNDDTNAEDPNLDSPSRCPQDIFEQLEKYLKNMNFKENTQTFYHYEVKKLRQLMADRNITSYTPEVGRIYFNERFQDGYKGRPNVCVTRMIYILDCLYKGDTIRKRNSKKPLTVPFEFSNVLNHYEEKCLANGIAEATQEVRSFFIIRFLRNIKALGCCDIKFLSQEIIIKACASETSKNGLYYIGIFLEFLFENNYTSYNFRALVPKFRRPETVPSVYSADEIERVVDATRRDKSICSKRDSAIVLLGSRYGIRGGDIARLTAENIDFKRKRISFIQHKTKALFDCPLFSDVENALKQYLEVRPESKYSELFLQVVAPYLPLTRAGVYGVVDRAFKRAGVDTSGKHHGPHALRSTNASLKVNSGMTYAETKQSIGWIDTNIMKKYVKIDIERLRLCALEPVPVRDGSLFDSFLQGIKHL